MSNKTYSLACDVCGRGSKLDSKQVEGSLKQHPISFFTRYSWTFLVAAIALAVVAGSIRDGQRAESDQALIEAPHPDDRYVINLAKLLERPEASDMYGVMKVKAVSGRRVDAVLSNVGYNKPAGAQRDLDGGKADAAAYYGDEVVTVPVERLQEWRRDGTIKSAHRLH